MKPPGAGITKPSSCWLVYEKAFTVQYYENFPPKKQVIENDQLTVQDSIPDDQERLVRVLKLVRRARNNLFHGEKFRGLLEGVGPQRDIKLLEYGLTILLRLLYASPWRQ
jgi:hypothetical protein